MGPIVKIIFLVGGPLLIIFGALMVLFGQSISCFVAIERNTRATHEIIRSQISGSDSSSTHTAQPSEAPQPEDEDDEISRDNLFK
jgi:hypothetical protein